jgi:hypothetical protein
MCKNSLVIREDYKENKKRHKTNIMRKEPWT